MTSTSAPALSRREPELAGQTVVVIGGSSGIGMETARRARAEAADIILTGRNPDRLKQAATELGAQRTAAFDATDSGQLAAFFQALPAPIDHVLVTGPGPYYARLADLDRERAHRDFDAHLWLAVAVAQQALGKVRPGRAEPACR
jgi:NAD(P)-dependent dehydrogenase (short-subunit alcohol dehydrogenase family)